MNEVKIPSSGRPGEGEGGGLALLFQTLGKQMEQNSIKTKGEWGGGLN